MNPSLGRRTPGDGSGSRNGRLTMKRWRKGWASVSRKKWGGLAGSVVRMANRPTARICNSLPIGYLQMVNLCGTNNRTTEDLSLNQTVRRLHPHHTMNIPTFSVVRTTRTAIEADLLIAAMRSEGLHPLDLETTGHFSLAGTDVSFHIQLPTAEISAAREFLKAYDESTHAADMRCSEPGGDVAVAIIASHAPGR